MEAKEEHCRHHLHSNTLASYKVAQREKAYVIFCIQINLKISYWEKMGIPKGYVWFLESTKERKKTYENNFLIFDYNRENTKENKI